MERYEWRPGWRPSGVAAEVAASELRRIKTKHGTLTAENLAEESRPKDAPLHSAIYHVSVKGAAQLYYLERARKIIQAVFVVQDSTPSPIVRAFQFVVRPETGEGSYEPSRDVVNDPVLDSQVRDRLRGRMHALRDELRAWDEFGQVVAAIDEVLAA